MIYNLNLQTYHILLEVINKHWKTLSRNALLCVAYVPCVTPAQEFIYHHIFVRSRSGQG